MPAVPKNKITRVERGKRRKGNTADITKDLHATVPMHKRGFVASMLKAVGVKAK